MATLLSPQAHQETTMVPDAHFNPRTEDTEAPCSFSSEDVSNCREHSSWDPSPFPASPLIGLVEALGTICLLLICVVILADDGWISILMARIYYTIRATLLWSQLENEGWLGSSPSSDNSLSSIKSLFSMKFHLWSTANPWAIACSIMEVKTFYPFKIKFYFLWVPVQHPEPMSFVSFIMTLSVG